MPSVGELIQQWGYLVVFAFIFVETALLVGFFLPGDTLLLFAGYYAATGYLNLALVIVIASIAAIVGDSVGYSIGRRGGRRLFKKEDSVFFSTKHLRRAEVFFEKHGPITVMIARPIAFLRTFSPVVAGIGQMNYKKFITYNIIGGVAWVIAFSLFGWSIGEFLKGKVEIETVNKAVDLVTALLLTFTFGSMITAFIYQKLTKGHPQGVERLRKMLRRKKD
ncbi:MAG: DedA family protein [bacterium]